MRDDDDVFLIGEDVAAYGGVFHNFDGIYKEFGDRRVIDTPISEAALVGLGVGAAANGLRPVVDIMFMDFLGVCLDQVVNQAAKMKFMFGGAVRVPLTITTAYGAGVSAAAQHSQSLEAWLAHTPGLKVVMPTTAYDAKGLIVSAIRDDNPVIFMQHKMLFGLKGDVPEQLYEVPLGQAAIRRSGTAVTIVALGRMVHEALTAADTLAADGIECEVIDPRTVQPLDSETIVESARRTNRVLVVHEAVRFGGLGAEIASQIQEDAFDYLDAPVARLGAPFTPVPFSPSLEDNYLPNATKIAAAARALRQRG
jgi:pyruvate dehydrogenase E1 component beta subunit